RQPDDRERFARRAEGTVARDLALAKRHDPSHGVVRLQPARDPAHRAATQNDDVIADRLDRLRVRTHLLPDLGYLVEVAQDTGVSRVAAALHARPGERQELDVRVVEREQRVEIAPPDRVEGAADDLDVGL